ncbi:hypothetical protein SBRCBS47491_000375 [Sporothrix bragantina]|uniref:Uncharacterized protein n=1 Tax=Sporothrix bragantina TaxID=671064 RepID=A0ABP0APS5_9PEZI
MAQALEQNLAMSRVHNKQEHHQQQATGITGPEDWQALLSRLQRIVALLPLQNQGPAAAAAAPSSARFRSADASYTVNRMLPDDIGSLAMRRVPEAQVGSKTSESRHSSADIPVSASESRNSSAGVPAPTPASELRHAPAGVINARHRPSFSQTPAGQNALNRITYMGGILLPFSIIAGVLSMSDPFGPGDRLFWVFWVITLPITAFTLAVIYADDIRKSYIWSPMNHKSLQDAISRGEAIPAATAAALARATERINDKFSAPDSDSDSDIESETVLSAVRPVESPTSTGQTRARARVRVHTSSDPSGPLFYRLSEPSRPQQCRLSSPGPFVSPEGVANNHGPSPMVTPEENVEIQTPIMNASIRRRSHILGPLRRGWSTTARPHGGDPSTKPETGLSPNNIEAANPYGETVMIDVARPNVDPDIAEMFGPPNGIDVTAPGCPTILLAQRRRDTDPAAWRRQQLGWIGAIKKMTGYLKTQDA